MRLLYLMMVLLSISTAVALPIKLYVTEPITVQISDQTLSNQSLFLANRADCPVIIIGNQFGPVISNVVIANVEIDGNKQNQTRELYQSTIFGPINNNGIQIQNATHVTIRDVVIKNCRSGGLVTTMFTKNLRVDGLTTYGNYFDGIACYQTMDSEFSNILSYSNNAAGLSFDMMFNRNHFNNVKLHHNSIGIFMRDSNFNTFTNLSVYDTKLYELFLAQVNEDTNTGCSYNQFLNTKLEKSTIYTNASSIGNTFR